MVKKMDYSSCDTRGGPEARREGQNQDQTEVFKCESMSS